MLSKVINTTSTSNPTKFNDVLGRWAEDAINGLSYSGIVKGAGDGSFKPNAKATRSESLLMILRMLNVSPGLLLDIVVSYYMNTVGTDKTAFTVFLSSNKISKILC